jgi:membrane protease YdiL (CAAX protease family)
VFRSAQNDRSKLCLCYLDLSNTAGHRQGLARERAHSPPFPFLMCDSPLTTPIQPSPLSFFRSPGLPFAFVRVCLYLILGQGITYVLRWIARAVLDGGLSPTSPQLLMTGEIVALAGAFSAALVMARLEKRSFGEYGLALRGAFGKLFWQGALFGAVEISTVIGALAALGYYHFGFVVIHGSALLRWAVLWAVSFVLVGLYEEFAFRGYVQFTFAQGLGFWPAGIVLSIVFGVIHLGNPGETWTGIAGIVLAGLFWCFTLRRTGSLWFAVGMHASFDFGETFLYSVPDSGVIFPGHLSSATLAGPTWLSGGTAGPEASVFDFLVLLLFFYGFHRLYPANSPGKTAA